MTPGIIMGNSQYTYMHALYMLHTDPVFFISMQTTSKLKFTLVTVNVKYLNFQIYGVSHYRSTSEIHISLYIPDVVFFPILTPCVRQNRETRVFNTVLHIDHI